MPGVAGIVGRWTSACTQGVLALLIACGGPLEQDPAGDERATEAPIRGVVVDPLGAPCPGAAIRVTSRGQTRTEVADARGELAIPATLARDCEIAAADEDWIARVPTRRPPHGLEEGFVIQLARAGVVRVHLGEAGIERARHVGVLGLDGSFQRSVEVPPGQLIGEIRIPPPVGPSRHWQLSAWIDGQVPGDVHTSTQEIFLFDVEPGEVKTFHVALSAEPPASVRFALADPSRERLPGASVRLAVPPADSEWHTDENGELRLEIAHAIAGRALEETEPGNSSGGLWLSVEHPRVQSRWVFLRYSDREAVDAGTHHLRWPGSTNTVRLTGFAEATAATLLPGVLIIAKQIFPFGEALEPAPQQRPGELAFVDVKPGPYLCTLFDAHGVLHSQRVQTLLSTKEIEISRDSMQTASLRIAGGDHALESVRLDPEWQLIPAGSPGGRVARLDEAVTVLVPSDVGEPVVRVGGQMRLGQLVWPQDVRLSLEEETVHELPAGALVVECRRPDGSPCPGVELLINATQSYGPPTFGHTDRDGRLLVLGLPAGHYAVQAMAQQLNPAAGALVDVETSEMQVVLEMSPGVPIRGRVTNEQGEPLLSAEVSLYLRGDDTPIYRFMELTDGEGVFEHEHAIPGHYEVQAVWRHKHVPRPLVCTEEVVLEAGEPVDLKLVARRR